MRVSQDDFLDFLYGMGAFVACLGITLAAVWLLVGCTPGERPVLISAVRAEEFDTAPVAARQYRAELTRNARLSFGLNAPIPLLAGQIEQESGWNTQATSRVGAAGLCQAMPGTARAFPDEQGLVEPYNPSWCLRLQSQYMKQLKDSVHYPRECDCLGAALSSYNGGLGWHNKRQALAGNPTDYFGSVRTINPGITPGNQHENETYAPLIVQRQKHYLSWGAPSC